MPVAEIRPESPRVAFFSKSRTQHSPSQLGTNSHCVVSLLLFLLFVLPVAGQKAPTGFRADKLAEMDAAINQAIAERKLPGAVLWLERHGQVYHRVYGSRAVEPKTENMTEDTIFDLASLTKVVATAPAIMLLAERGKLNLEQSAHIYLPEFKGERREAVTLRQLLTHTSGLPSTYTRGWPSGGYEDAIRKACAESPQSSPGSVFRYSDINFILLAEIVRRVSGLKLDQFAAREIYKPLKMEDTGFLPPQAKRARIAPTTGTLRGVVHDGKARAMGGVAGHAGVFGTAADLARYARTLLQSGQLDGTRIFKAETVKLMTSVQTPESVSARRGFGWDIDSGYSRRGSVFPIGSYGHTGFTGVCLWIDPFSETFWIFLSNRVHVDSEGNIIPLQNMLGTLAAESVEGFDFAHVQGALPPRMTNHLLAASATNGGAEPGNPALRKSGSGSAVSSTSAPAITVLNGIDVLERENFTPLKKLRIGLITNHTGHDRQGRPTIDLLKTTPGVTLKALFSPEHGIRGKADEKVGDSVDETTGLPVYSLYGQRRAPIPAQLEGLDALAFDIQDIGCRFYTYISTMGHCLEAAGKAKLKFFVLDRVNPINGVVVEGPIYQGNPSFTAFHSLPLRYGMTIGELAQMFNAERGFNADLTVIKLQGWRRELWFDETGLPWTNPSPNMRSLTAAAFYPGLGLHETALSVGRGTGTPFEIFGSPYIDAGKVAAELNDAQLPGVRFVPTRFIPNYSTFKDKPCEGVRLVLSNRDELQSVDIGIVIASTLQRLYPKEFALAKINSLLQDRETIEAIRAGKSLEQIKLRWTEGLEEFKKRRARYLLY